MKVESKVYKGIKYIRLDELPGVQRDHLLQTLRSDYFIKIMIDGQIVSHCVQYKDYDAWYDAVFASALEPVKEKRKNDLVIKPTLALNS